MQSFKNRLLILIVGLMLFGQGVTIVLALAYLKASSAEETGRQLDATRAQLDRVLDQRASELGAAASVLVADAGFREVVASGDRPTIRSALDNHSRRINADLALLYDRNGELLATSSSTAPLQLQLPDSDQTAVRPVFAVHRGKSYQMVLAPVRAPDTIAWAVMGFALDQRLVQQLQSYFGSSQGIEISVLNRAADSIRAPAPFATVGASTLQPDQWRDLAAAQLSATDPAPRSLLLGGEEYLSSASLLPAGDASIHLVVHRSLREATQMYYQLRTRLLQIASLTLCVAALLAWYTGRGAVRPLNQLVQAARRIQSGEYDHQVDARGGMEFQQLAQTFNSMQAGIREREQRIVHQGSHDQLTQLPNRAALLERLAQWLAAPSEFSLAVVDVRLFRDINASVGHAVGDQLLQRLGEQLAGLYGERGICARLGADQFAVGAPIRASALLHRFLILADELRAGVVLGSIRVSLELRAGLTERGPSTSSAEDLLRQADMALLEAKETDASALTYRPAADAEQRRRILLVQELRSALATSQLHLVYQPLVRCTNREPVSYEALLRWQHPELGTVSPSEFIPLAERASLMPELSQQVLQMAVLQLAEWRAAGFKPGVAVNLSAGDLGDGSLVTRVLSLLQRYQVDATQLKLEVTETAIMRDPIQAAQVMQQLRQAGVRFAIDDFGTGHSSLAHLQALPAHELKIDQRFIIGIEKSANNQAIVRATTELAHCMGLLVVAEGVETLESWSLLLRLGCDHAQGFLISRPMGPEQVARWHAEQLASANGLAPERGGAGVRLRQLGADRA